MNAPRSTEIDAILTDEQYDDLWQRIVDVRDDRPRAENDASTDSIITEAVLPFLRDHGFSPGLGRSE